MNDEQFKEANNMFQACLKKLKLDGIGDIKHKDTISEENIKKLFSTQTLKWWVESDFKALNLPLSLRLKVSGCHYNSMYNNT